MNLDYRTADGKSHTHAGGFGGGKGVEQPARILGGDHLIVIGIVIGVADPRPCRRVLAATSLLFHSMEHNFGLALQLPSMQVFEGPGQGHSVSNQF